MGITERGGLVPDRMAMSEKDTNPKDSIGCNKLPLHLWPTTATALGCLGMLNGALKYGRANFRERGVRASIYIDACKRHLDAWFEGEELDPDDGVPHLAAALSCIAIVVDAGAVGKLTDDRNVNGGNYRSYVDNLTQHVPRLRSLHEARDPKHYTIKDTHDRNLRDNCKQSTESSGATQTCSGERVPVTNIRGPFSASFEHL